MKLCNMDKEQAKKYQVSKGSYPTRKFLVTTPSPLPPPPPLLAFFSW